MKRLLFIFISLCVSIPAFTQTPVEKVITEYSKVRGSRDFIASGGGEMILARSLIRKTPLAAIAPDVDVLEVLKMQNASKQDIGNFVRDLKSALASYDYYGQAQGTNGIVNIYITRSGQDTISELVIYNPEIYSVNSLKGTMSLEKLMQISKVSQQK